MSAEKKRLEQGRHPMENEYRLAWNLNNTVKEFVDSWVIKGQVPEGSLEGIAPDFSGYFKKKPDEITLDHYKHNIRNIAWDFKPLKFENVSEDPFYFYVPKTWSSLLSQGNLGNILKEDHLRQTIFVLPLEAWYLNFQDFLISSRIIAFSYNIVYGLSFLRWVFITEDMETKEFMLYGVYSSGKYVVQIKASAKGIGSLENQLTSLINTSPWENWIQQAVKFKN